MTSHLVIRPVLALAAVLLASCGGVDGDPNRFENFAENIAAIPMDGQRASDQTAGQKGLRPALQPVRVEVMDPHALWDARDAGLRGVVEQAAPKVIEAAAPAVIQAVSKDLSDRAAAVTRAVDLRPALPERAQPDRGRPAPDRALVQLGAFSTENAARAAWSRLKNGEASWALADLSPVFEPVQIGERRLVRLKVPAPAAGAAAVCAAAGIDDPWCRRAV